MMKAGNMRNTRTKQDGSSAPKISPEAYAAYIEGLNLAGLRLQSFRAETGADAVDTAKRIDLDLKATPSYKMNGERECLMTHMYELAARYEGKRKALFKVSCRYEVLYRVAAPMTDEIFGIFSQTSLTLTTWPFFREFVHNATARMGMPPLPLPVLRTPGKAGTLS